MGLLLAMPWRVDAVQRTMTNNVPVGDPIDGLTPTVEGVTNTYDFASDNLDMAGFKIYYNAGQRHLILTNLTELTDSGGTAIIDTSRAAEYVDASFAKIYASSSVALGGYIKTSTPLARYAKVAGAVVVVAPSIAITNASGLSIDSRGAGSGGAVTLLATNVTLAGGIGSDADTGTSGVLGGAITINDGAGGPARVEIGGDLTTRGGSAAGGAISITGTRISLSNVNSRSRSNWDAYVGGGAVNLSASETLTVNGYIVAGNINTGGEDGGAVTLTAIGGISIHGTTNGISIETRAAQIMTTRSAAANITLVSTNGDIAIVGGLDASHGSGLLSRRGTVSLSAPNGGITVGSLDANLFKTISIQAAAGQPVYVTGAITNFSVSESPKEITFPAGSVIGNDMYYLVKENTAIPLSGTYAILSGTNDTGRLLKQVQDQGSVLVIW